ncbi:hypothetical protein DFQ27_000816 [Actinomortierella ambigua]|uniref:Uncharacterized protein n=1 Tax=Actinomortierella ambigua TaxID=1343610 RepID=A0A9P6PN39_9FUNG|nr:hypothetical protein DFQ27_000816 [Actinomortierella ambigua]
MLFGVAIGAPVEPTYRDGSCGSLALHAQESSRLPELNNYTYRVLNVSGSAAKAAFPNEADNLSADKTYRFIANLRACKPRHAFKIVQESRGASKATRTKTLYDLSLEINLSTYATLFKHLPPVSDVFSISGGNETVVVPGVRAGINMEECVFTVGWKCDGELELKDGDDEYATGVRIKGQFFPVSIRGRHLFRDLWINAGL